MAKIKITYIPNNLVNAAKWHEMGGLLDSYTGGGEITDRVTSFENGGLHSENGGIPIGQNSLVEKDEYMYTTKDGKKYIFSNKF